MFGQALQDFVFQDSGVGGDDIPKSLAPLARLQRAREARSRLNSHRRGGTVCFLQDLVWDPQASRQDPWPIALERLTSGARGASFHRLNSRLDNCSLVWDHMDMSVVSLLKSLVQPTRGVHVIVQVRDPVQR